MLRAGDSRDVLRALADASVDSVVTDPPYALISIVKRFGSDSAAPTRDGDVYSRASAGFMGKTWDTGETAFAVEFWREVLRVLKPGGHVVAASGTRTYHRLAIAIEDAGFEIRDMVSWLYGSGFPKSHDVSKGIDRAAGAVRPEIGRARRAGKGVGTYGAFAGDNVLTAAATAAATADAVRWQGWGTALKPACEPWVLARKPLAGTVAANVMAHGAGALNIDACRVATDDALSAGTGRLWSHYRDGEASCERTYEDVVATTFSPKPGPRGGDPAGRWPANVIHDGSDDVVSAFPMASGQQRAVTGCETSAPFANVYGSMPGRAGAAIPRDGGGSAARFFYSAKADAMDRLGSKHPTVKPIDLMQYLCRLVTPPGGVVLDPFAGTGTTGEAAWREGFQAILIEREAEYCADIRRRLAIADAGPMSRRAAAARGGAQSAGPLFVDDVA
ncbi:MAG: site-specific DNA-methyltransferase [Sphingomonadales bacterium]|nr:site-specific DNA-methyltransferase [Sphingomonadales bacterium]